MNITNTYTPVQTCNLSLSKMVSGQFASKSKDFSFEITLKDKDGSAVAGSYAVESSAISGVTAPTISSLTFTEGKATVSLKHGQSIKIKEIPEGYTYEVREVLEDNSPYTSQISVKYGSTTDTVDRSNTGEYTIVADQTVAYTNVREDVVPTGIHTNFAPLAVCCMLIVLLAGIAVVIRAMRRNYRKLR
jgi:fibronectin-binding protein 1